MYEFIKGDTSINPINRAVNIINTSFIVKEGDTQFSVGENIGTLFSVSINGISQIRNLNFSHTNYTSKITFLQSLYPNSVVTINYYKGINSVMLDNTGKLIQFIREEFTYTGSTVFNLSQSINSLMTVETNGLAEEEHLEDGDDGGFVISTDKQIEYLYAPVLGSTISVSYFF
jgi:hypothetical protein